MEDSLSQMRPAPKSQQACKCGSGKPWPRCCGRPESKLAATGPKVTAIVPTYNRPELLARALASIRNQRYQNIEIVVVNDAGTDVGPVVADNCGPRPCRLIHHEHNRGLAAARNTALRAARGKIMAYLDDDDTWLPDHVARLVAVLRSPGVQFAYTQADFVTETHHEGQYTLLERSRPYAGMAYSREWLHVVNYIPVNTWGHWQHVLDEVGYFDERLSNHEDWDFLLRCARNYDIRQIAATTVQVHQRVHSDNMLRREKPRFEEAFRSIYARYDDLGDPKIAAARDVMLKKIQDESRGEARVK